MNQFNNLKLSDEEKEEQERKENLRNEMIINELGFSYVVEIMIETFR